MSLVSRQLLQNRKRPPTVRTGGTIGWALNSKLVGSRIVRSISRSVQRKSGLASGKTPASAPHRNAGIKMPAGSAAGEEDGLGLRHQSARQMTKGQCPQNPKEPISKTWGLGFGHSLVIGIWSLVIRQKHGSFQARFLSLSFHSPFTPDIFGDELGLSFSRWPRLGFGQGCRRLFLVFVSRDTI